VREEYVDRGTTDPGRITQGAVEGMLDALGDGGHTRFFTAEEMEETREGLSGEYVGVGVQLEEQEDGEVSVLSPLAGSPAECAGVRPGDVVVGVGGWNARGAGVEEVVERIKGPEGTEVVLAVERENVGTSRERRFDLPRETIDAPAASWAPVGPGGETALVSLSSFTEDAAAELRSAFGEAESEGATSYVLDLRGNPGGELEEAVAAASLFLDGPDRLRPGGRGGRAREDQGRGPHAVLRR
jgi:carboxyl-terminal processing protease